MAVCALAALASGPVRAAEEICQGRSGTDLIRCIEAAARTPPASQPAPQAPGGGAPAPAARVAAPSADPPPEDCTGRSGQALRRCLAAGGRLRPEAAMPGGASPERPGPSTDASGNCEALKGEALRACVARAAAGTGRPDPQTSPVDCTALLREDQALCIHRNQTLNECRDRKRYPDERLCLRSFASGAPIPAAADCRGLPAARRPACEARNRANVACASQGLSYFACLERRLGTGEYVRWR